SIAARVQSDVNSLDIETMQDMEQDQLLSKLVSQVTAYAGRVSLPEIEAMQFKLRLDAVDLIDPAVSDIYEKVIAALEEGKKSPCDRITAKKDEVKIIGDAGLQEIVDFGEKAQKALGNLATAYESALDSDDPDSVVNRLKNAYVVLAQDLGQNVDGFGNVLQRLQEAESLLYLGLRTNSIRTANEEDVCYYRGEDGGEDVRLFLYGPYADKIQMAINNFNNGNYEAVENFLAGPGKSITTVMDAASEEIMNARTWEEVKRDDTILIGIAFFTLCPEPTTIASALESIVSPTTASLIGKAMYGAANTPMFSIGCGFADNTAASLAYSSGLIENTGQDISGIIGPGWNLNLSKDFTMGEFSQALINRALDTTAIGFKTGWTIGGFYGSVSPVWSPIRDQIPFLGEAKIITKAIGMGSEDPLANWIGFWADKHVGRYSTAVALKSLSINPTVADYAAQFLWISPYGSGDLALSPQGLAVVSPLVKDDLNRIVNLASSNTNFANVIYTGLDVLASNSPNSFINQYNLAESNEKVLLQANLNEITKVSYALNAVNYHLGVIRTGLGGGVDQNTLVNSIQAINEVATNLGINSDTQGPVIDQVTTGSILEQSGGWGVASTVEKSILAGMKTYYSAVNDSETLGDALTQAQYITSTLDIANEIISNDAVKTVFSDNVSALTHNNPDIRLAAAGQVYSALIEAKVNLNKLDTALTKILPKEAASISSETKMTQINKGVLSDRDAWMNFVGRRAQSSGDTFTIETIKKIRAEGNELTTSKVLKLGNNEQNTPAQAQAVWQIAKPGITDSLIGEMIAYESLINNQVFTPTIPATDIDTLYDSLYTPGADSLNFLDLYLEKITTLASSSTTTGVIGVSELGINNIAKVRATLSFLQSKINNNTSITVKDIQAISSRFTLDNADGAAVLRAIDPAVTEGDFAILTDTKLTEWIETNLNIHPEDATLHEWAGLAMIASLDNHDSYSVEANKYGQIEVNAILISNIDATYVPRAFIASQINRNLRVVEHLYSYKFTESDVEEIMAFLLSPPNLKVLAKTDIQAGQTVGDVFINILNDCIIQVAREKGMETQTESPVDIAKNNGNIGENALSRIGQAYQDKVVEITKALAKLPKNENGLVDPGAFNKVVEGLQDQGVIVGVRQEAPVKEAPVEVYAGVGAGGEPVVGQVGKYDRVDSTTFKLNEDGKTGTIQTQNGQTGNDEIKSETLLMTELIKEAIDQKLNAENFKDLPSKVSAEDINKIVNAESPILEYINVYINRLKEARYVDNSPVMLAMTALKNSYSTNGNISLSQFEKVISETPKMDYTGKKLLFQALDPYFSESGLFLMNTQKSTITTDFGIDITQKSISYAYGLSQIVTFINSYKTKKDNSGEKIIVASTDCPVIRTMINTLFRELERTSGHILNENEVQAIMFRLTSVIKKELHQIQKTQFDNLQSLSLVFITQFIEQSIQEVIGQIGEDASNLPALRNEWLDGKLLANLDYLVEKSQNLGGTPFLYNVYQIDVNDPMNMDSINLENNTLKLTSYEIADLGEVIKSLEALFGEQLVKDAFLGNKLDLVKEDLHEKIDEYFYFNSYEFDSHKFNIFNNDELLPFLAKLNGYIGPFIKDLANRGGAPFVYYSYLQDRMSNDDLKFFNRLSNLVGQEVFQKAFLKGEVSDLIEIINEMAKKYLDIADYSLQPIIKGNKPSIIQKAKDMINVFKNFLGFQPPQEIIQEQLVSILENLKEYLDKDDKTGAAKMWLEKEENKEVAEFIDKLQELFGEDVNFALATNNAEELITVMQKAIGQEDIDVSIDTYFEPNPLSNSTSYIAKRTEINMAEMTFNEDGKGGTVPVYEIDPNNGQKVGTALGTLHFVEQNIVPATLQGPVKEVFGESFKPLIDTLFDLSTSGRDPPSTIYSFQETFGDFISANTNYNSKISKNLTLIHSDFLNNPETKISLSTWFHEELHKLIQAGDIQIEISNDENYLYIKGVSNDILMNIDLTNNKITGIVQPLISKWKGEFGEVWKTINNNHYLIRLFTAIGSPEADALLSAYIDFHQVRNEFKKDLIEKYKGNVGEMLKGDIDLLVETRSRLEELRDKKGILPSPSEKPKIQQALLTKPTLFDPTNKRTGLHISSYHDLYNKVSQGSSVYITFNPDNENEDSYIILNNCPSDYKNTFKAYDCQKGCIVILKFMKEGPDVYSDDPDQPFDLILNEMVMGQLLDLPYAPGHHPIYDKEGLLLAVHIEYIDGITLEQYQQKNPTDYINLAKKMLEAVKILIDINQEGLFYSDIKGDNFLVGNNGKVYIIELESLAIIKDGLEWELYAREDLAISFIETFRGKSTLSYLHDNVEFYLANPKKLNSDLPDGICQLISKLNEPFGSRSGFKNLSEVAEELTVWIEKNENLFGLNQRNQDQNSTGIEKEENTNDPQTGLSQQERRVSDSDLNVQEEDSYKAIPVEEKVDLNGSIEYFPEITDKINNWFNNHEVDDQNPWLKLDENLSTEVIEQFINIFIHQIDWTPRIKLESFNKHTIYYHSATLFEYLLMSQIGHPNPLTIIYLLNNQLGIDDPDYQNGFLMYRTYDSALAEAKLKAERYADKLQNFLSTGELDTENYLLINLLEYWGIDIKNQRVIKMLTTPVTIGVNLHDGYGQIEGINNGLFFVFMDDSKNELLAPFPPIGIKSIDYELTMNEVRQKDAKELLLLANFLQLPYSEDKDISLFYCSILTSKPEFITREHIKILEDILSSSKTSDNRIEPAANALANIAISRSEFTSEIFDFLIERLSNLQQRERSFLVTSLCKIAISGSDLISSDLISQVVQIFKEGLSDAQICLFSASALNDIATSKPEFISAEIVDALLNCETGPPFPFYEVTRLALWNIAKTRPDLISDEICHDLLDICLSNFLNDDLREIAIPTITMIIDSRQPFKNDAISFLKENLSDSNPLKWIPALVVLININEPNANISPRLESLKEFLSWLDIENSDRQIAVLVGIDCIISARPEAINDYDKIIPNLKKFLLYPDNLKLSYLGCKVLTNIAISIPEHRSDIIRMLQNSIDPPDIMMFRAIDIALANIASLTSSPEVVIFLEDSLWHSEEKIREMAANAFSKIAILRPELISSEIVAALKELLSDPIKIDDSNKIRSDYIAAANSIGDIATSRPELISYEIVAALEKNLNHLYEVISIVNTSAISKIASTRPDLIPYKIARTLQKNLSMKDWMNFVRLSDPHLGIITALGNLLSSIDIGKVDYFRERIMDLNGYVKAEPGDVDCCLHALGLLFLNPEIESENEALKILGTEYYPKFLQAKEVFSSENNLYSVGQRYDERIFWQRYAIDFMDLLNINISWGYQFFKHHLGLKGIKTDGVERIVELFNTFKPI
ncbi:MAG: hypothetical protein V1872_08725, partial [bacterium]